MYGELGKDFIYGHHIVPLNTIGKEYKVDYETDLIPVCPNCHAMLHRKLDGEFYSVEELKEIVNSHKKIEFFILISYPQIFLIQSICIWVPFWLQRLMCSTEIKGKMMFYLTSKPFSIMLFLRISMAFIVSGPETLLIIRLFSLNLPMK